jgi:predicted RNA-binding Zn ribbon-like protein
MNTRPAPLFFGEHPAMDFLNTVATPAGTTYDWLADGADLVDWLERSALIDHATAGEFREGNPRQLDRVAKEARALREWLRRFVKRHAGNALKASAQKELEELNELLAKDHVYFQIEPRSGPAPSSPFELKLRRRWAEPEQLLQPIAAAVGDLISTADFRLLRACENPDCTIFFYDRSKNHRRRWCSMAMCGNRAKVAAFRNRQT